MTLLDGGRILAQVPALTHEQIVTDLQKNLETAIKKGNLAQANRSLQLLQAALTEQGEVVSEATDEQVMAALDAIVFDDDILREHFRRRLAEFDASREALGGDSGGAAAALDLLSPARPSILFPGGVGL